MAHLLGSSRSSKSPPDKRPPSVVLPSSHWNERQRSARDVRPRFAVWSLCSDRFFGPHIRRSANFYASALEVPDCFIQLLFLIEDKRFGFHPGIDPISILRALVSNSLGGHLQGASTITQQLYDVLKTQQTDNYRRPRTVRRKLDQALWSVKQEWLSSKVEILNNYLAHVYWGRDYFGLDAASRGYFGSSKCTLSAAESFFLAERLASPNVNCPERVHSLLQRSVVRELLTADGSYFEVYDIYEQWEGDLR
ncbi:biosynthetic peptidoglycan transglycosylase [Mycobacterium marseillense]|uniref:Glycosyl transferase family 51 domain-containing protein n=1 Tax=Mycobacterium marseillense TaxID=701042 RepID=A0AAC9YLX6_9MYCO|nr:biosynthetic peptidoglycan transglycosylase [Mycobacterium marseillense]ASW91739.1 hypothetical protein CKJ54_19115 [Mycobacterium marseillense]